MGFVGIGVAGISMLPPSSIDVIELGDDSFGSFSLDCLLGEQGAPRLPADASPLPSPMIRSDVDDDDKYVDGSMPARIIARESNLSFASDTRNRAA
jgi:hypothetical protein